MNMETMVFRLPLKAVKEIEQHAVDAKLMTRTWLRVMVLDRLEELEKEKDAEAPTSAPKNKTHATQTADTRGLQ